MIDLSRIDVPEFLQALGVEVKSISGHNALFSCPFGHEDRHPSARMSLQDTRYICSSCGAAGSAISFLARLNNITNAEARDLIEGRYGIGRKAPLGDLEVEVRRNLGLDLQQVIDARYAPSEDWVGTFLAGLGTPPGQEALNYMIGRGFDPDVLVGWEVGFDQLSGRVAIPVRDANGALVGFKGRAIRPTRVRYLLLGDAPGRTPSYGFSTFSKSEHVFGLNRVEGGHAVVVEGELNVIAMSHRAPSAVAVGVAGSEFSEAQRALVVERLDSVVVWFDDDPAGRRGLAKVAESLAPFVDVRVTRSGDGRDAAEMSGEEIEQVIDAATPWLGVRARSLI